MEMFNIGIYFLLFCALVDGFEQFSSCRLRFVTRLQVNPKPSGLANTKEGKEVILNRTKELVAKSSMILVAPIQGVSKEHIDVLRSELPEGTVASVVKNSLLRLCVADTSFRALLPSLKHENLYFFIPEGATKKAFEGFQRWRKDVANREGPEFDFKAIALEGEQFLGPMIEEIAKLPSKKELLAKLAMLLQSVPTRLARSIQAVPLQVGRALNSLKDQKAKVESS